MAALPLPSTYPQTHLCQAVELTAADVPLLVPPLERPALQNRNPDAPGSQCGGGNDAQSPAQVWGMRGGGRGAHLNCHTDAPKYSPKLSWANSVYLGRERGSVAQ